MATYSWAYRVSALVVCGILGVVIAFPLLLLYRMHAPWPVTVVILGAAALMMKAIANIFVIKVAVDPERRSIQLRRSLGPQVVAAGDIQQGRLILLYKPERNWMHLLFPRIVPWISKRIDFDPYLELITSRGAVLYPLPSLDYKAGQATATYYTKLFQPVLGDRFKVSRVDLPLYLVVQLVRPMYWRYGLAALLV